MAKVRLGVNSRRILGKHLPTPVFKRIELQTNEDTSNTSDMIVNSNITIYFTKPKEMTDAPIASLVENYFDNLYLYLFISPFGGINSALEAKQLAIKDLLDAMRYQSITPENFAGPSFDTSVDPDFSGAIVPESVYSHVIAYQQSLFLAKLRYSFANLTDSSEEGNILNTSTDNIFQMLNNPLMSADPTLGVNPIYRLFWGVRGEEGRWITDLGGDLGEDMENWLSTRGWEAESTDDGAGGYVSFMTYTLSKTLKYLFRGGYSTPGTARNVMHKIKLSDLAVEGNDYNALIVDPGTFDNNADEVLEISNINIRSLLNTSNEGGTWSSITERLGIVDKLFVIATVGLDTDDLGAMTENDIRNSWAWGVEYADSTSASDRSFEVEYDLLPSRSNMNSFFGNIVYEQIMEKGEVFQNPREAFYYVKDDTQYDGIALRGWDYKYYVNEPVSRAQIISALKMLIDENEGFRSPAGNILDTNLKNLESILQTSVNDPNLFFQFRKYARTYEQKSQATNSGRFYADFIAAVGSANQAVMQQDRLKKLIFKNVVVQDMRSVITSVSDMADSYVIPIDYRENNMSSTVRFVSGTPTKPFGGYIPNPWARYSSCVHYAYYEEFENTETGFSSVRNASEWWRIFRSLISTMTGLLSGAYETGVEGYEWVEVYSTVLYEGILSDDTAATYRAMFTAGEITLGYIVEKAEELTDRYFAMNSEYEFLGLHDYSEGIYGSGGWHDSRDHQGNRVVVNNGIYKFDWEKALHVHSALALVVSPAALQRWLGYRCPYLTFPCVTTGISRQGVFSYVSEKWETCAATIEARFGTKYSDVHMETPGGAPTTDSAAAADWPYPITHYTRCGSGGTGGGGSGNRQFQISQADCEPVGSGYSNTSATQFASRKKKTYAKFANFDVANSDISGIKTLRSWVPFTPEFGWWPTYFGTRPAGDYRLVTIEFQDILDDDLAYYNFVPGTEDSENSTMSEQAKETLRGLNTADEECSQYIMYMACEDNSLMNLWYLYYDVLKPVLDRFEEYEAYAQETCSYNNIEDRFNDFFADGIEEFYEIGSAPQLTTFAAAPGPQPPWFETPYVISALVFCFQKQYTSRMLIDYGLDEDLFRMAQSISLQCHPRTGSLSGVAAVKEYLKEVLKYITLEDSDVLDRVREVTGIESIGADGGAPLEALKTMRGSYACTSITAPDDPEISEIISTGGGSLPPKVAWFFGSMHCDQPIFGDVMLDKSSDLHIVDPPPDQPTDPDLELDFQEADKFEDIWEQWQERIGSLGKSIYDWLRDGIFFEGLEVDSHRGIMIEVLGMVEGMIRNGILGWDYWEDATIFYPLASAVEWAHMDAMMFWEAYTHIIVNHVGKSEAAALNDASLLELTEVYSMINAAMMGSDGLVSFMSRAAAEGYTPSVLAVNGILQGFTDHGISFMSIDKEAISRGLTTWSGSELLAQVVAKAWDSTYFKS